MMTDSQIHSDLPIPPGEYLEEVLEEIGMSKAELAKRMGRPASKLSSIFKGQKAITPDTALQLEKVVGVPAHIWTGLESEYRLALARQQEQNEQERLKAEIPLVPRFNYAALAKLGAVPKTSRPIEKVIALQKFLGVASLSNLPQVLRYSAAFRCGKLNQKRSPEAVAAWLRFGEIKAKEIECAPFNRGRLEDILPEVRNMTQQSPTIFYEQMIDLFSSAGVALILCPHFPRTYAHGATFPLGRKKAVLMLTIRGKWADIFWFSLFHEIGHILLHGFDETIIECDEEDPQIIAQENEADKFAADYLIPLKEFDDFVNEGSFYPADIEAFARQIGIHAGIVVGRLHKEEILRHEWRNDMRVRYEWDDNCST